MYPTLMNLSRGLNLPKTGLNLENKYNIKWNRPYLSRGYNSLTSASGPENREYEETDGYTNSHPLWVSLYLWDLTTVATKPSAKNIKCTHNTYFSFTF